MGPFPAREGMKWYATMLSSGIHTHRNYALFRYPWLRPIFNYVWHRSQERLDKIEGANLGECRSIADVIRPLAPDVPIMVTGGFQTGKRIADAITRGDCDAVTIARPLIANNAMVQYFERGEEIPQSLRCTYCNKCLINVLANPLGCYELSRFDGDYDRMIAEVMTVFEPKPFH
jgi:2,4-dienoyl-CoA reductase (NADPH2)